MTKHKRKQEYHALIGKELEIRRNELFPNGHPCGWERSLKVNASLEVRSECALTPDLNYCIYTGLQRKDLDYEVCPVYLAKLKEWHSELKR
jgi:hypothetical protein